MNRARQVVIALNLLLSLTLAVAAQAAPPKWSSGGGTAAQPAGRAATMPPSFDLQCPAAFAGIRGDLLSTGWEPVGEGQPVSLVSSQVQDQYLYCVYGVPTAGRQVNASITRLIPAGYSCITDGAGGFQCRRKPQGPGR